jgi:hypothetical protein
MRHSKSAGRVIFWDFDRTLAYRPKGWTDLVAEVLGARSHRSVPPPDEIRPHLEIMKKRDRKKEKIRKKGK